MESSVRVVVANRPRLLRELRKGLDRIAISSVKESACLLAWIVHAKMRDKPRDCGSVPQK
jgi:hypothetical protein